MRLIPRREFFTKFVICVVYVFVMIFMTLLISCSNQRRQKKIKIIYDMKTASLISRVTTGVISPDSHIKVVFVKKMVPLEMLDVNLETPVLSFEPEIDGVAKWLNNHTLEFIPNSPLSLKKQYMGSLNLEKLLHERCPKGIKIFRFTFQVAGREIESINGDFAPVSKTSNNGILFRGIVKFTQKSEINDIKDAVTVSYDGKIVTPDWNESSDGKKFVLTVSNLKRDNHAHTINITVWGNRLGCSAEKVQRSFSLPPSAVLNVVDVKPVEMGTHPYCKVLFSEPLDPGQQIQGLITSYPVMDLKLERNGDSVILRGKFQYGKKYVLTIHRFIRSKFGSILNKDIERTVKFKYMKPEIYFASSGVFLASDNRQSIRFHAVNVKKVHISIKRIFESNFGQFLQVANLNSSKERWNDYMETSRVGVSVYSGEFDLDKTPNVVRGYDISIGKLLKPMSKGLFIISISFKRKDMIYPALKKEPSYDYENYYNDPNSYGYIGRHGKIFKTVILTDIGLSYQKVGKKQIVYATNLLDARPMEGVKITLKTYQNQDIDSVATDINGRAVFLTKEKPFYVLAEKGGMCSVVLLRQMEWDYSSFDTSGVWSNVGGIRGFTYTDRGVYRPGDTVHLSFIARDEGDTFPDNHPVTVTFINPKGQKVSKKTIHDGVDGFYSTSYRFPANALTGQWQAVLDVGPRNFIHNIMVETVVPFRLKVKVVTDKRVFFKKKRLLSGSVKARYLIGTPASKLAAEVELSVVKSPIQAKCFPGYIFDYPEKYFKRFTKKIYQGILDARGSTGFKWNIPDFMGAPSRLKINLEAKVIERGGRPNIGMDSVYYNPYHYYVGIKKPMLEWGYVKTNTPMATGVVAVDSFGKPAPGRVLTYTIYENERYWWWEYRSTRNNILKYKSDGLTKKIKSGTIITKKTPVQIEFSPPKWGEYLFEVSDKDGHIAGYFFHAGYWGNAAKAKGAAFISLKSDRPSYHPGETAVISFTTPNKGSVFVTIFKGDKMLSMSTFPTGENNLTKVNLKITEKMWPNCYFTVSVIQPHSQSANDRPIRMYGILPIMVEKRGTRQKVIIKMPSELKPDRKFTIHLSNDLKTKTQYTIAVVDEGLLDLTSFTTPDPWRYFNKKERFKGKAFDMFDYVINAMKGDAFNVFAVGGGMSGRVRHKISIEKTSRLERFKPVALFAGPIKSDRKGKAEVTFRMPHYVGSVRIMVVSAYHGTYGHSEKSIPVKKALMIMPTLPRVLHPGDDFEVPVSIFAMKNGVGKTVVSIETDGPLKVKGLSRQTIILKNKGDKNVVFKLSVSPVIGRAKVIVRAYSSKEKDYNETYLKIVPNSPELYKWKTFECKPGDSIDLSIPKDGIKGSNHAKILIMLFPNMNIGHRIDWLIHYPYGCIEQTISSVFPQLYLSRFVYLDKNQMRKIDSNINGGIERLSLFELPSGGFSYWPGSDKVCLWGTNYAGYFLIEAKRLGYHVPDGMYNGWLEFQHSMSLAPIRLQEPDELMVQAFRLYLLALAGEPAIGPMNLLKEDYFDRMSDIEKWLLAASYKVAGDAQSASAILRTASLIVKPYEEVGGTFGSILRDKAILLNLACLFERSLDAKNLFDEISEEVSSAKWYSTQTLSFSLLSMAHFVDMVRGENSRYNPMKGYIEFPGGKKVRFSTMKDIFSLPIEHGFGQKVHVHISKSVKTKILYVVLQWRYVPLFPKVSKQNYAISTTVEWLDENGMKIDPTNLPQGKTFYGHFRIYHTGDTLIPLKNVVLTQMLPSGWEIENTRLHGEKPPRWTYGWSLKSVDYTDIRDDRISYFFTLYSSGHLDLLVKINTVTVGTFLLPPNVCQAMYVKKYRSLVPGMKVSVTRNILNKK